MFLGVYLQPGLVYKAEVLVVPIADFEGKGRPRVVRIRESEVRFPKPPIDDEGYVGEIKYEFPLSGRNNLPEIEPEELNDDVEDIVREETPLQGGSVEYMACGIVDNAVKSSETAVHRRMGSILTGREGPLSSKGHCSTGYN